MTHQKLIAFEHTDQGGTCVDDVCVLPSPEQAAIAPDFIQHATVHPAGPTKEN
jgi:hypothetical protein